MAGSGGARYLLTIRLVVMNADGSNTPFEVGQVFTHLGLKRDEVEEASAGDIIAITGMEKTSIGDTLASPEKPEALAAHRSH